MNVCKTLFLATALAFAACGDDDADSEAAVPEDSAASEEAEPAGAAGAVTIKDIAFAPAEIRLSVGDSVTWTNQDATGHTATSGTVSEVGLPEGDGLFDGAMEAGQTFSHTFEAAGTFSYFCTRHPDTMKGTVTVTA